MAIIKEEDYFPRGRSATKKPALRKSKDSLFTKHKKPKKKSKKSLILEEKLNKKEYQQLKSLTNTKHEIIPLTYQILQEGMVVLGRVREIWPYHMFVCLPGRLSAKVAVASISNPYTEALARLRDSDSTEETCLGLSEMFRVGQPIVCSVIEVHKEDNLLAVSVSLEPSLVNKGLHLGNVKAGSTLMAAIQSQEDHGYTLHTGITGLIAFLPHTHAERFIQRVNGGRSLAVGEVVRCLVTRCKTAKTSSRVEVTVDPDVLNRAVLTDLSIQTLIPAARVRCTVDQVTKAGLMMSVGDRRKKAYVEHSQLKFCWSEPEHYKPNTELVASVLYVLPQSDLVPVQQPVYLTLKDSTERVEPTITIGATVQAVVTSSGYRGVTLCLGETKDNNIGNRGFVSIRRLGESMDKQDIAGNFPKGKVVTARILTYDYMEQIYNCSLEKDKLEQQFVKADQLSVGDRVTCEVVDIEEGGLKLALGSMRLYAFKDHSADIPYSNLYQNFARGNIVDCRVLKINPETRYVTVTLKETLIRSPALYSYEAAHVGDGYWGTVVYVRDNSLYVTFYNDVAGTVQLTGSDHSYVPGQLVKCFITYVNVQDEKLLLSLTPPISKQHKKLFVGESYELVVSDINDDYLIVSACDYDDVGGVIPKSHLQDPNAYREGDFIKAWLYLKKAGKYYFSPNSAIKKFLQPVGSIKPLSALTCCVARITKSRVTLYTPLPEFRTVEMLVKKFMSIETLQPHQIVKVYVKHIDTSSNILKLTCKKPKALQNVVQSNSDQIIEKDPITLKAKKRKKERTERIVMENDFDQNLETDEKTVDKQNLKKKKNDVSEKNMDSLPVTKTDSKDSKKKKLNKGENGQLNMLYATSNKTTLKRKIPNSESVSEDDSGQQIKKPKKPQTLTETGFQWDVKLEDLNKPVEELVENEDEDEEDSSKGKKKKSAAERRRAAKEEEARLRKVEQALLDSESNPQSVDQFDRAVLARPDDADLWIKYMSHHLQATEIEKARSVAKRALQTINQRLEVERLNVWIALLNLENLFGTQESLKESLDEALKTNDEFTVYCKMLQIYSEAKKSQEAEQLVHKMVRKFRNSLSCWIQSCTALMSLEMPDKARSLLQRAISALPSKEHVSLLCKFALLENQHGFSEQAQTLFEHILTSYPKRTDIWNVYVDMLVKSDKIEIARQILARATRQKLAPRKMKMLFSKWLNFEERHGSPEKVEQVRGQMLTFVNNITKKLE